MTTRITDRRRKMPGPGMQATSKEEIEAADWYHVCHSCGHSAYWNDMYFAYALADYPCSWCGGETGYNPVPADQYAIQSSPIIMTSRGLPLRCMRQNAVGLVPAFEDEEVGSETVMLHRADGSCCHGYRSR